MSKVKKEEIVKILSKEHKEVRSKIDTLSSNFNEVLDLDITGFHSELVLEEIDALKTYDGVLLDRIANLNKIINTERTREFVNNASKMELRILKREIEHKLRKMDKSHE